MGASIYWRPLGGGVHIPCDTPSSFREALSLPRTFTMKDYEFLRGVAVGNKSFAEPIQAILDALNTHGEVEVYAEY